MEIFINSGWKGTKCVSIKRKPFLHRDRDRDSRAHKYYYTFLILFDSLQHSNEIFASPLDPFIKLRSSGEAGVAGKWDFFLREGKNHKNRYVAV